MAITRWVCRALLLVVGVSLPLTTTARLHVWGDERLLWTEAVSHSPLKPRPLMNLGREYVLHGADRLAVLAYQRAVGLTEGTEREAVEGPMRVRHQALLNLALAMAQGGDYQEALRLTAEIQPRDPTWSTTSALEATWRAAAKGVAFSF